MNNCGVLDHCCWFSGVTCKYLTASDKPEYMYACSLRKELGSWDAVHSDQRYIKDVKPKLRHAGYIITDCGDWPPSGITCHTCGKGE